MQLPPLIIATFALYLIIVLLIGLYAYRLTHNATDYFLGGRNLPAWVAALSAGASDTSGWLLIGLPGYAYVAGLEAVWIAVGLCAGVALSWVLVARRLRVFSLALDDVLTLPSYFQRRFRDPRPWLRVVCAAFILLFFLFYVSSGLIGGAKLFNTVFGLPYGVAVWVGGLAVVSYTLFGGFLAVSWTDVFQGLLITVALICVPVGLVGELGGAGATAERLAQQSPALWNIWTDGQGRQLGGIAIAGLLGWGLGYFGQPHILARFKALRSPADAPVAGGIAVSWSLLVYSGAVLVGCVGAAYFDPPLVDGERVFMRLIEGLFHPAVAGVLLAAILAAIMSTADSQLLVCSSALAEDLYPLWAGRGRTMTPAQSVVLGRWAVSALALLAAVFAMDPDSRVLDVVAYAWAGLGAAFGPALLLSLYWRRMNARGAFAGVIAGGLTVVIWRQLEGGLFDLYELVPGFLLSLTAIVVVSLVTPAPEKSVAEAFDDMLEPSKSLSKSVSKRKDT